MKNRKHHPEHRHRLRNLILSAGLILIPLALLLLRFEVGNFTKSFRNSTKEPLRIDGADRRILNAPGIEEHRDRPSDFLVYPYSVVNGGVNSVSQLQLAISRDPVVAKHYSNFKLDRAKVIEAPSDGSFHVSYRIGQEIFWTKKKLRIAKGEKLITDGAYSTRTRCANRLSEVPQGETSSYEPPPEVLDTPELPVSDRPPFTPSGYVEGDPPETAASLNQPTVPSPFLPGGGSGSSFLPEGGTALSFLPGGGNGSTAAGEGPAQGGYKGGGGEGNGDDPPAPVPEPITLFLIASGLVGLWGFRAKFKK